MTASAVRRRRETSPAGRARRTTALHESRQSGHHPVGRSPSRRVERDTCSTMSPRSSLRRSRPAAVQATARDRRAIRGGALRSAAPHLRPGVRPARAGSSTPTRRRRAGRLAQADGPRRNRRFRRSLPQQAVQPGVGRGRRGRTAARRETVHPQAGDELRGGPARLRRSRRGAPPRLQALDLGCGRLGPQSIVPRGHGPPARRPGADPARERRMVTGDTGRGPSRPRHRHAVDVVDPADRGPPWSGNAGAMKLSGSSNASMTPSSSVPMFPRSAESIFL